MKESKYIIQELKKLFPDAKCELSFTNPYTLLVSVILSAQCTDKRVNQVTPELFKKYPTVYDLAKANQSDVEMIIKSCGFYNNKAKNIIACSKQIVDNYNGEVPTKLEDLIGLSGVGRKTANVVLSTAFNIPATAVDTHVFRVSNRIGIVSASNVDECEKQLMQSFPKEEWLNLHQCLVLFGRYICKAQKPSCENCVFSDICKESKCKSKK